MPVYLPLIDKAEPCRLLPETLSACRVGALVARFLVLLFCLGTGLLATQSHASAETRSLKIYNVHTGEKAVISYKRNGRYIRGGLNKLDYILRDWRKDKQIDMDPRMLDLLWEVYQKSGSNDYIHIICGYRTGDTNAMLRGRSRASGVAKKSQHVLGKAIDFYLPDVALEKVREIGMKFQVGGVGYYPNSGSPFVHMDTGWVRAWPRMSRPQLVRLFPNGRTLHLPPDGKPLPGYEQALADYKRRVDSDSIMVAGGGSSGRSHSSKNLLAALFGGGDEDEGELGADDTVQTDPALHRIERKAMARVDAPAPSKAVPVTLPKPVDAPLPGVRPVAVAAATPQQAAPAPAVAESQTADATSEPEQKFPDLLAYAIPVPQLLPDRAGEGNAQDATAALIADANANMPNDGEMATTAKADAATQLAMIPVPEIRPELTAYAETPEKPFAPALKQAKAAEIALATPKLRPSVIVKAMEKSAPVHDKIIMASLTPQPTLHMRNTAKPEEVAKPKSFDTVSGADIRGGRVDGAKVLTKDAIAQWARAKGEEGTPVHPYAKGTAAPRMNRLPVRSAEADEETGELRIDPQRFAAVSVYFPND